MNTEVVALVDIGSTFTKAALIRSDGVLVGRAVIPTRHDDLAAGAESAVADTLGGGVTLTAVLACSSAAGGLRVAVIGFEPRLTLEAGRRAAATAGARVVATYGRLIDRAETARLAALAPDVVLLTGGTDGGDRSAIVANARSIAETLSPNVPIVVAGNEDAASAAIDALAGGGRVIRVVANVLPRIGALNVEAAQAAIRELFVDQVIGRGRFSSSSRINAAIQMPTPSAVLAATEVLASLASRDTRWRVPVVVDVGGATTDVHSMVVAPCRGFHHDPVPERRVARTVEGDLGLRENADALADEAIRSGYIPEGEGADLRAAAQTRALDRGFLARERHQIDDEHRLARLAVAIALARHAGELKIHVSAGGATLRHTGRDLRQATCIVATGGVFEAASDPAAIVAGAVADARARGALLPERIPTVIDRRHLLAPVGLLAAEHPALAAAVAERAFDNGAIEHAA